jgi:hypothetical protein
VIARIVSVAVGALMLAGVAHVTVLHTGGYGTPQAALTWAVMLGIVVGSVFTGMALSAGRFKIAFAIIVCIVAGEAYNFLQTGDRLIAGLEHAQAPKRGQARAYAKAQAEVGAAAALVAKPATTSKRLEDATAAKTKADAAVVSEASKPGCRRECRLMLDKAADDAAAEVSAARAEIDAKNSLARTGLDKAKADLDNMQAPESASPLADTLGISPRLFAILVAILGSVGINGLACCLMIYGTHAHDRETRPRMLDRLFARMKRKAPVIPEAEPRIAPPSRPRLVAGGNARPAGSIPKILSAALEPAGAASRVEMEEIYGAYARECARQGVVAVTPEEFVDPLKRFCRTCRITAKVEDGKVYLMSVRLVTPAGEEAAAAARACP